MPTKRPKKIPMLTPEKSNSGVILERLTPAFAKANKGKITKVSQNFRLSSISFKKGSPFLVYIGIKNAEIMPAKVA